MSKPNTKSTAVKTPVAKTEKPVNPSVTDNVTTIAEMEDGTHVQYTLANGKVIEATILRGKPACPTCGRTLPKQKALTAEQKAKTEQRMEKLAVKIFAEQKRIKEMLQKTAKRMGLTEEEMQAMLAKGEAAFSEQEPAAKAS